MQIVPCESNTNQTLFSLTQVTAPDPPFGFKIQLDLNRHTPVNPFPVFLNALYMLYRLSYKRWHSPWLDEPSFSIPGQGIEISVQRVEPTQATSQLEVSHVLLGLYQGVLAMSAQITFFEALITIRVQGHSVGKILILSKLSAEREDLAINTTTIPPSAAPNDTANDEDGRIVDPDNNRNVIEYTWDGVRVNSKDVFLTFMDSFLILAERASLAQFSYFDAVSADGNCVLHVNLANGPVKASNNLVERLLLLLVTRAMVKKNRFETVTFSLEVGPVAVAEGWLMSLPLSGNNVGVSK